MALQKDKSVIRQKPISARTKGHNQTDTDDAYIYKCCADFDYQQENDGMVAFPS